MKGVSFFLLIALSSIVSGTERLIILLKQTKVDLLLESIKLGEIVHFLECLTSIHEAMGLILQNHMIRIWRSFDSQHWSMEAEESGVQDHV